VKRGVVIGALLTVVMQWPIAAANVAGASGGLRQESSPDAWIAIALIFMVLFVGALVAALGAQRKEMMREARRREDR
jgi:hypothetical protein